MLAARNGPNTDVRVPEMQLRRHIECAIEKAEELFLEKVISCIIADHCSCFFVQDLGFGTDLASDTQIVIAR